jgi:hypothetical protein
VRLLLLLSLTLAIHAARQQPAPTGSIEGVVLRADTGAPIAGAQVTLTTASVATPADGPSPPVNGTTNAEGKFSFTGLKTASYRVAATANGFIRQQYGQGSPNGQGRLIYLAANQSMKEIVVRLAASGTVSGRVFDELGQPATGAAVQLLRVVYTFRGKSWQESATARVDDRGDFRIYALTPGRYYIAAGTTPGASAPARGGGGGPATAARYSIVYYPNAPELDQAASIDVKPTGEVSVDMHVRRVTQTYRVRARVVDPRGIPLPQNVNYALAYRWLDRSFSTGARIPDPATGIFEMQNVAPGEYTLKVQAEYPQTGNPGDGFARLSVQTRGQITFRVIDKDVEDLVVPVTLAGTANGRVVVEGQTISALAPLDRIFFNISPTVLGTATSPTVYVPPAAQPPKADGSFQVFGLRDDEVRMNMSGFPSGFYIKSMQYDGRDILGKGFKFNGSGSEFVITVRAGAVQINGKLTDAKSQPVPGAQVFLLPSDRMRLDLFKTATSDQNGAFSFPNLPPGDYKAFSWESVEPDAHYDPDFVKNYETQSSVIHAVEGSTQTVNVRFIPTP